MPSLSTRLFLHRLSTLHPHLQLFALVDCDPFGIRIFCNYRFGSTQLQAEDDEDDPFALPSRSKRRRRVVAKGDAGLPLLRLQWIGVKMSQIFAAGCTSHALPLSDRDRTEATRLCKHPTIAGCGPLHAELEAMMRLNAKAEIESLLSKSAHWFVQDYLVQEMASKTKEQQNGREAEALPAEDRNENHANSALSQDEVVDPMGTSLIAEAQ